MKLQCSWLGSIHAFIQKLNEWCLIEFMNYSAVTGRRMHIVPTEVVDRNCKWIFYCMKTILSNSLSLIPQTGTILKFCTVYSTNSYAPRNWLITRNILHLQNCTNLLPRQLIIACSRFQSLVKYFIAVPFHAYIYKICKGLQPSANKQTRIFTLFPQ